jgi:transcriptional regulator with XRE-family HTH domain
VTLSHAEKDLDALNGRFIEAMEDLGYTGYSLSKKLGTSEAVISNIRNRKNPPNIQLVRELLNKHLELDPDWLLFGRGEMKRLALPTGIPSQSVADMFQNIEKRILSIDKRIDQALNVQLERTVVEDESMADLEDRISSLEKKIESLRKVPDRKP